jgi:hypothetical protein
MYGSENRATSKMSVTHGRRLGGRGPDVQAAGRLQLRARSDRLFAFASRSARPIAVAIAHALHASR